MDWDHLAEEKSQRLFAAWLTVLPRESPALPLSLAAKHRPGFTPVEASDFTTGAYNMCSIVTFEDGFRVVVRFPILGRSRFRTEKSNDEIPTMQFLMQQTRLPVPAVLGAGQCKCGPYTVLTFQEGACSPKESEILSWGHPTQTQACPSPISSVPIMQ